MCAAQRGRGRGDREDSGGDGDRDGQHVVDEQRGRGDEARQRAEVLLRDDVRAAARSRRPERSACTRGRRSRGRRRSRSRRQDEVGAAAPRRRPGRPAPPRSHTRRRRAGRRRRSAARANFESSVSPSSAVARGAADHARASRASIGGWRGFCVGRGHHASKLVAGGFRKALAKRDLERFLRPAARAYAVTMRTRLLLGTAASAAAVALVTGAVYALEPVAPVLSLGVLYLFAVLPVAALWGLRFAVGGLGREHADVQLVLPAADAHVPLADSENWVALAVYLVHGRQRQRAGGSRSQPGGGSRAAAAGSRVRRRGLGGSCSSGRPSEPQLRRDRRSRAADLLGVSHCWIELGPSHAPAADEQARDARGRRPASRHGLLRCGRHSGRRRSRGACSTVLVTLLASRSGTGAAEPERRDEDGGAALGQPRPALAADRDLRPPREMLAEPGELLAAERPRRAARLDPRRRRAGSTGWSATCSTSRGSRRARRARCPSSGRSTSSSPARSRRSGPTATACIVSLPADVPARCASTRRSSSASLVNLRRERARGTRRRPIAVEVRARARGRRRRDLGRRPRPGRPRRRSARRSSSRSARRAGGGARASGSRSRAGSRR